MGSLGTILFYVLIGLIVILIGVKFLARKKEDKVYVRPGGGHYHTSKDCCMLQGGDFERLGYVEITFKQAAKRRLSPCACSYREVKNG